jgi:hypothetical protein
MKRLVFLVAVFSTLAAAPAFAYLDPISGSVLLQGLIGGIAAILASFRSVRMKIAGFFKRSSDNADKKS